MARTDRYTAVLLTASIAADRKILVAGHTTAAVAVKVVPGEAVALVAAFACHTHFGGVAAVENRHTVGWLYRCVAAAEML